MLAIARLLKFSSNFGKAINKAIAFCALSGFGMTP